ncbi:O-antigen ligase family protein [Psychromonas hadalis]|uniref:O-antigen ligase family protein n=1 Tax=Psychromonas hadalis TaxID=211669 RepID=UPI0003B77FCD|nr:O-antigen ligase family protein [Psychromonas hadalis]
MNNKISICIYTAIFLAFALLLATPNFNVIVIAILSIFSLYLLVSKKEKIHLITIDWIVIGASCSYLIAFIPTTLLDGETIRYLDAPLRFILSIPIYLLLRLQLSTEEIKLESIKKVTELGIIVGSMGALCIAIYQTQILKMERVDGFLFSINFAYLACALAFLGLVFFRHSNYKTLNLIGFACAIIATLLTLTRGAIIAIPLLLILTLFLLYKDKLTVFKVSLFILIVGAVAILAYQTNSKIKQRADYTVYEIKQILKGDTVKATSSGGRIQLWVGAIEAFKESPLIGKSYREREAINQQLYNSGEYKNSVILASRGHAHSQYFEILASAGLLGITALLLYLFLPLAYYYRLFSKNKNNIYALNGFIFTTGICIYGLTEVLLQANSISTFYAFVQALLLPLAMYFHKKTSQ